MRQGGGNKTGETIVDERVTLLSAPLDPELPSPRFDGDGLPLGRQVRIETGVMQQPDYSRVGATRQHTAPAGAPQSIRMTGDTATIDDLIAATRQGVLGTRLSYLRETELRTIRGRGLARDGVVLIEKGTIARAIRTACFDDSPLFVLDDREAEGRAGKRAGTEQGSDVVMPASTLRNFDFTSLSEAV